MKIKNKRCRIDKKLKKIDIYGQPITLTFNGKEHFTSTMGGVFSICVLFCVVGLFFYKLDTMFSRT